MLMHKNYYLTLIATLFIGTSTASIYIQDPAEETLSVTTIGNLVIQPDAPKNKSTDILGTPEDKKPKTDFTIIIPTLFEQKKVWFGLLQQTMPQAYPESIFDVQAVEKLHLIGETDSGSNLCLLKTLPTQTVFGNAYAAHKLAVPAADINTITKTQEAINYFIEHPATAQTAQHELARIADNQGLFFSCFPEQDTVTKQTFDQLYFEKGFLKRFNNSAVALGILRTWQNMNNTPAMFPARILKNALIQKAMLAVINQVMHKAMQQMYDKATWDALVAMGIESKNYMGFMIEALTMGSAPGSFKGSLRALNNKYPWLGDAAVVSIAGCATELQEHLTLDRKTITRTHNSVLEHMRTKLTAVATVLNSLKEINTLVHTSPELTALPDFVAITELFASKNSGLRQLIGLLQTGTFTAGTKLVIVDSARILTAYHLMREHKEAFTEALHAAGALDSLVAVTNLMLQHQNTTAGKYCFVDLVKQDTPVVAFTNFWNPLMAAGHVVTNTVNLGNQTQTMILTGPNGSGKSVLIKGIVLNIALAQAFGIAAAEKAAITPFDTINVYLNVQENLQQGTSTFMAEKQQLTSVCNKVATLPAGHKSLTLIDEPLKGTVEQSGGQLVHDAVAALTRSNNITLIATHFKKPTELESARNGACVNYHVELKEPTSGNFTRTFKLIKGSNMWWFNDAQKRDRFIAWLSLQN